MSLTNPTNFSNGDVVKINGGELVTIRAGGQVGHCGNSGSATNPLAIARAQYGTTAVSAMAGQAAISQAGLGNSSALAWDSDYNVILYFGSQGYSKVVWVYCPTVNNPVPGTVTAAQSSVGCSINGADDWSDITAYSKCADRTCVTFRSGLGSGNGATGPNYYYPGLEFDPVHHKYIQFSGGKYQLPSNSTWTAAWDNSSPIRSLVWTNMHPTCSGADCAAGPGPESSAPVPTSNGNENRPMHAIDPSTGQYYYHSSGHSTIVPTQDWVYDSVANSWTEIQVNPVSRAPNIGDNMTFDSGKHALVVWGNSVTPGANPEIWVGVIPGGTPPTILTGDPLPGGIQGTAYS